MTEPEVDLEKVFVAWDERYSGTLHEPVTGRIWRCEHDHPNNRDAIQCARIELQRRKDALTRRTRIRLPGIHADIVLARIEKHAGSLDSDAGVSMSIARDDIMGSYSEIELTSFGVTELIDALKEVGGL
jgi:hypothetical protein